MCSNSTDKEVFRECLISWEPIYHCIKFDVNRSKIDHFTKHVMYVSTTSSSKVMAQAVNFMFLVTLTLTIDLYSWYFSNIQISYPDISIKFGNNRPTFIKVMVWYRGADTQIHTHRHTHKRQHYNNVVLRDYIWLICVLATNLLYKMSCIPILKNTN